MEQKCRDIYEYFSQLFSFPRCELNYENVFELLISVILSSQCTDKRVNEVTKELFKVCKTPTDFLNLGQEKLEEKIYSCGFYKNKAKNILSCCSDLIEKYNSCVPNTLEELTSLAGVGRKTANVVLAEGFNQNAIAVDTHVLRVAKRLGLSTTKNPNKTEEELKKLFDEHLWRNLHQYMVLFGRYHCKSKNPACENCKLKKYCNYFLNLC